MPRYNTKPIDYTGCDEIIAEHLKRGEAIECECWDTNDMGRGKKMIVGYDSKRTFRYLTGGGSSRFARPLPIKRRRIMPPERAIPVLIAEGWRYTKSGCLCKMREISVQPHMFEDLGKLDEESRWFYPECIIEEVDE